MIKPTIEQILAETDEQKLAEWVAVFCMGWRSVNRSDYRGLEWVSSDDTRSISKNGYNPCQNKAQAIELAEKFELEMDFEAKSVAYMNDYSFWFIDKSRREEVFWKDESFIDTWMTGAVKASLCSVVSE